MKNHPLFPDAPDAEIDGFHVTRKGPHGPEYAHPLHLPEQITELSQVFELYGGGNYELVARGTLPGKSGEKGKKGIVARAAWLLGGDQKPLNPGPPGVAPAQVHVAPPQGASDTAAILSFMGQQMNAQMQLMGTIITAALANKPQDNGTAAALTAMGEIVKASLQRPAEVAAAVGPDQQLKALMDMGDWISGMRAGAAAVAAKAAAGQDTTMDLDQMMKLFDKGVDVVKKAKGLAEEGKPPHVAADELAQMAAAE